jgi:2-amino-4-hydroxy-6-hydroxymethyldihydropteridine diphosphokinase
VSAAREVAISLGSNLGDRSAQLAVALRALDADLLAEMQVSRVYETAPVAVSFEQPDYLNLCVVGLCELDPEELLTRCRSLERASGRETKGHREPRTLDLDLLYHGESRRETAELSLPHPALHERRFVLAPLAELRPDWRHPADGRRVDEMLAGLGEEQALQRREGEEGWWRHE